MSTLLQDVRYTLRSFARSPGFTAVAVLTLALGIGATTAIFSAVSAVLLRPLPYPDPDRLTVLWLNNQAQQIERDVTSFPAFLAWREASAYEAVAGYASTAGTFTGDGDAEQYAGAFVTSDFFRVLGVLPRAGQAIGDAHVHAGESQVVVLSHGMWIRRFGADPAVLGRSVVIDGEPREVIGVAPQGFAYPDGAQYWLPIAPAGDAWQRRLNARFSLWLSVIGRLSPGVSVERASAELNEIMSGLENVDPVGEGSGVFVEPLRDTVVGHVRPALLVLLGAVGFVLLIACANVANLMLARGAGRRKELAVRTTLGATGGRLARQVLTECLVLGVIGGAVGILLAVLGTNVLVAASPPDLPRTGSVRVDAAIVGFAALLAVLTAVLCGLAPAVQARTAGIAQMLRESGRGDCGERVTRLRRLLVTAEIALSLMLLVGAGLLIRSFAALQSVDPGFAIERVLSFRVSAGMSRYPEPPHVRQFHTQFLERLNALPGVEAATGISTLLLSRLPTMGPIAIEGQPPRTAPVPVTSDVVDPGFFHAMRIPIVRGRELNSGDILGGMPVVVVNETFVRRFLPDADPIGRRLTRGDPEDPDAVWQTIVGVAADSRRSGLFESIRPEAYRPLAQAAPRSLDVLVRTAGAPLAIAPQIRATLRDLDPNIAIAELRTVEQAFADAVATRRFVMMLVVGFATLAVGLAAIGIYGVLSYIVGQRTRELGIRMALGADRPAVLALVLRQSMRYALPGVALGAAGALTVTRLLRSQLFGISPADPLTFAGATLLLVGVGLLASWIPAYRATRVQPLTALRVE
jgi:predicted permease